MASRRRLGAALLLDPPRSDEINGLRRALRDGAIGRIPPHVTLVPPVNVRAGDVRAAMATLRAAAARCRGPLRLTLGPAATFLPDNPVVYLPVGGDIERLRRLHDNVFAGPLVRPLEWPWIPHVTLADDAPPGTIEAALVALAGYQVVVDVDRVVLLEERTSPAGFGGSPTPPAAGRHRQERRWLPLADAALGPPAVVGRGGRELTLVQGRVLDPDGAALVGSAVSAGGDQQSDVIPTVPMPGAGEGCAGGAFPETAFAQSPPIVVTALAAGTVVGVAAAWRDDTGGRVGVVVDPGQRGTGVGRHLLARVEDAARRAGWVAPVLHAVGPAGFYAACSEWSRPG